MEDRILTPEEQSMLEYFLDCETNEEKLLFLQNHEREVSSEFLRAAAHSLDFTENEGTLEDRCYELMQYLKTLAKYETGRLR